MLLRCFAELLGCMFERAFCQKIHHSGPETCYPIHGFLDIYQAQYLDPVNITLSKSPFDYLFNSLFLSGADKRISYLNPVDPDFFDLNIAYPLPGTELYRTGQLQGLFDEQRLPYGSYANAAIRSRYLSAQELTEWRRKTLVVSHDVSNAGTPAVHGTEIRVWAVTDPDDPRKLQSREIPPEFRARFEED